MTAGVWLDLLRVRMGREEGGDEMGGVVVRIEGADAQLEVTREGDGYGVALGHGSDNGDFYTGLTREQLRELRDALDAELFVDELEEALGGCDAELIKERL